MRKIKGLFVLVLILPVSALFLSCEEDDESGNIAFYRRVEFFDCGPLVVKVYLNNQLIGTIDGDFPINNKVPDCGTEKCLTISRPVGKYIYRAECSFVWDKCGQVIETWTGEVEVKQDSCSKVFIDILEEEIKLIAHPKLIKSKKYTNALITYYL